MMSFPGTGLFRVKIVFVGVTRQRRPDWRLSRLTHAPEDFPMKCEVFAFGGQRIAQAVGLSRLFHVGYFPPRIAQASEPTPKGRS